MNIECKYVMDIDIAPNGFTARPLTITIYQQFEVERDRKEIVWTPDSAIMAEVKAGDFLLFEDLASNLGGWMGSEVKSRISFGVPWDITDKDAMEMLMNAEDERADQRDHAAGRP